MKDKTNLTPSSEQLKLEQEKNQLREQLKLKAENGDWGREYDALFKQYHTLVKRSSQDLVKYVGDFFNPDERLASQGLSFEERQALEKICNSPAFKARQASGKGFENPLTLAEFTSGLSEGALARIITQAREVLADPVFDWVIVSEISGWLFESADGAQMWLKEAVKALEQAT